MTVDGKTMHSLPPDDASHTFAIPDLGISVPLKGVADDAKNQCSVAPVHARAGAHDGHLHVPHRRSPGRSAGSASSPAPRASSTATAGPMQSLGWMDGYLVVV